MRLFLTLWLESRGQLHVNTNGFPELAKCEKLGLRLHRVGNGGGGVLASAACVEEKKEWGVREVQRSEIGVEGWMGKRV